MSRLRRGKEQDGDAPSRPPAIRETTTNNCQHHGLPRQQDRRSPRFPGSGRGIRGSVSRCCLTRHQVRVELEYSVACTPVKARGTFSSCHYRGIDIIDKSCKVSELVAE